MYSKTIYIHHSFEKDCYITIISKNTVLLEGKEVVTLSLAPERFA